MGQYHYLVNLSKHECVKPWGLGDGLKLKEWSGSGMLQAMEILLAVSIKGGARGGGDFTGDGPIYGSWAGDRIAIIGDYTQDSDLPPQYRASTIFERCGEAETEKGYMASMSGYSEATQAEYLERFRTRKQELKGLRRYKDITPQVREAIEAQGRYTYSGEGGWMRVTDKFGNRDARLLVPDMVYGVSR